jgi:hypothetical protein
MTIRVPKWLLALLALLVVAGVAVGAYLLGRGSDKRTTVHRSSTAAKSGADADLRIKRWEARQGLDWATYKAQFKIAYFKACNDVFSPAVVRGGTFEDARGRQYTSDDCQANFPKDIEKTSPPDMAPSDPARAGQMEGGFNGCTDVPSTLNAELHGTSPTGRPVLFDLNFCYSRYQEYPGPWVEPSGVTGEDIRKELQKAR